MSNRLIKYRNRNRNLQTSKAPLKGQAQGTSLFTSAASNQRGFPIVRGRLRSGCQKVREGGCSLGDEWEEIESGESGKESLKRWDFSFEWKARGVTDRGA